MWELAEAKRSRLIVALDNAFSELGEAIEAARQYAVGVKIGLIPLLKQGPLAVKNFCAKYGDELYLLCDLKLADIPYVVMKELEAIRSLGFDGAILHLVQGGVDEVARLPERPDLFGVAAMSHPQSRIIDEKFDELVKEAAEAGIEGLIVPATKPSFITRARKKTSRLTLLSPGIGAQGAEPGSAITAGADFEIVGRAVTQAANPEAACRRIRDAINAALKLRGSR